jgi:hypothetical protein
MRYAIYIIPEPLGYGRGTILEERKYKSNTIVLGRDRYQHMIGIKCTKQSLVHPKSEKGFTVHWKKFFAELPPATECGGS